MVRKQALEVVMHNRRAFLKSAAAVAASTGLFATPLIAQAAPRVMGERNDDPIPAVRFGARIRALP